MAHRAPDVKGLNSAASREVVRTLNPSEVVLDFAGRMATGHRAVQAPDSIAAGDPVGLKQDGDRWLIVDRHNVAIGRLARKFEPPKGATFVEGSVHAIIMRYRSDSTESFQPQLRQQRWSVALPELVYTL